MIKRADMTICRREGNWRRPQICCLDIKRISKDREYDAAAKVSFEMRVFYVETV